MLDPKNFPYEIQNFVELYEKSFRSFFDLPCLTYYPTGESITYGQFAQRIAQTHLFFESIGVKPGDKIALCGKDTPRWVEVFMATVTYGAIIVPILPDFNPVDVTHIVNHSEAEIFVVADSIWEHIEASSLLQVKGVLSLDSREVLFDRNETELARALRLLKRRFNKKYPDGFNATDIKYVHKDNNEVAEINYTSGTTGFSKGVMLTGENLSGNVCFALYKKLHYPMGRTLAVLPLAHAYGCAFDMLSPLAAGTHIYLLGKTPSPKVLLKALSEVKPTLLLIVPLVLEKIYRNQILPMISKGAIRWTLAVPFLDSFIYSKIRKKLIEAFGGEFAEIIIGGAPLNKEVEDFLHKIKFPFTVGYGMTECGPLISYTPWQHFIPGSCGKTLPTMESKVISDDPENIPGEVCVRGTNVMKGYYKNPEATKLVFTDDGWLMTGDMGTRSEDGTLFLRGRSKTMILSASGQNIYPEEIEAKLNNMPFVAESLIIERDGRLVGLVYPDYEAMDHFGISTPEEWEEAMEKVRKDLNAIVAPYEQIAKIVLQPNEFEKTPKRSIKRYLYTR